MLRRAASFAIAAAMMMGTAPAFAAGGGDLLTYTVADGLDFDDTAAFSSADEAWGYADKIAAHVDGAADEMRKIFEKTRVSITDEAYGAEAHAVFPIVEGTYKKSAEDAAAESELAKKNTKAIYAAIKAVSEAGGGTVVVPAADGQVFYTAALHLEDNVNLCVEEGAVLKFTTDTSLYQGELMREVYGDGVDDKGLTLTRFESVELMNYSPFIYAYGKKNIALTGAGTLDGQATTGDKQNPGTMVWHQWKNKRDYTLPDGTTKEKHEAQDAPRTKLFGQGQTDVPVAQRQYGESPDTDWSGADNGFLRPNFIQPYNCQNVLIEGVTIENSPMWEINPVLCDTVLVQNVTVDSHLHNNDGCDPECTSNMVIRGNHFDVGDDCMAIKSGRNGDGLRVSRSSFNIVIEDNVFVDGHGGVTIGSEITNGVKNIFSRGNEMNSDELQAAYRFKTNYIRGGVIENVYYKDDTVKMVESTRPVILVDLNYDVNKEVQMMEAMNVSYQAYIPSFKHVLFENMQVNLANAAESGGQYAMQLNGFNVSDIAESCTVPAGTQDCYISDFTIRNATFVGSQQAFQMKNVDGLTLENVTIRGTTLPDEVANCKNLTFTNCDFKDANVQRATFADIAALDGTLFQNETEEPAEAEPPAEPEAPTETETPTEPANPAMPETPAEPATPAAPETPAEPVAPAKPAAPAIPAATLTPATPVEPGEALTLAAAAQALCAHEGDAAATAEDAVAWALEQGYITGDQNGNFDADAALTYEQAASILYRYAKDNGFSVSIIVHTWAPAGTPVWARDAVRWVSGNHLFGNASIGSTITRTVFEAGLAALK